MTGMSNQVTRTATLIIGLCSSLTAHAPLKADEEVIFVDRFDTKLADGWSWMNETPNGWRVANRALEIRVLRGPIARASNLLMRDAPHPSERMLVAEVTVSNQPTEQYEQCGIVWWYDERHFVKLVKEVVDGQSWIVMGRTHPTSGQLAGKIAFDKDDAARLRLEVTDKTIVGKVKKKGLDEWTDVGRCQLPGDGPARISLQTYHGPTDEEHWARFNDFSLARHSSP